MAFPKLFNGLQIPSSSYRSRFMGLILSRGFFVLVVRKISPSLTREISFLPLETAGKFAVAVQKNRWRSNKK